MRRCLWNLMRVEWQCIVKGKLFGVGTPYEFQPAGLTGGCPRLGFVGNQFSFGGKVIKTNRPECEASWALQQPRLNFNLHFFGIRGGGWPPLICEPPLKPGTPSSQFSWGWFFSGAKGTGFGAGCRLEARHKLRGWAVGEITTLALKSLGLLVLRWEQVSRCLFFFASEER